MRYEQSTISRIKMGAIGLHRVHFMVSCIFEDRAKFVV